MVISVMPVMGAIEGGTLMFKTLNLKVPVKATDASEPWETSRTSLRIPVVNTQVKVEAVKPISGRHCTKPGEVET